MYNFSENKRTAMKFCTCCQNARPLRNFAYLSDSSEYHVECNGCVARKAIASRSEVSLFVQEYGVTPKVFQSLRRRAEKMGYRRTQDLILAKLNNSQRRKYWFSFTVSKLQDHAIVLAIMGMVAVAFFPVPGLSLLAASSLFLIWASLYKRSHQDPITAAINFHKQVHIETCFLELKKNYQDRKKLPQLPNRRIPF